MQKIVGRRVVLTNPDAAVNAQLLAKHGLELQALVNQRHQAILVERLTLAKDFETSWLLFPKESMVMGAAAPSRHGVSLLRYVHAELLAQQELARDKGTSDTTLDCDIRAMSYQEHDTGWLYLSFSAHNDALLPLLASLEGMLDYAKWEQRFKASAKSEAEWLNRPDHWNRLMTTCKAQSHVWSPKSVDLSPEALAPFVPSMQERAEHQAQRLTRGYAFSLREMDAISKGASRGLDLTMSLLDGIQQELAVEHTVLHQEYRGWRKSSCPGFTLMYWRESCKKTTLWCEHRI